MSRGWRGQSGLVLVWDSAPLDRLAQTRQTLEEPESSLTEVKPRGLGKTGDSLWRLLLVISACKMRSYISQTVTCSRRSELQILPRLKLLLVESVAKL